MWWLTERTESLVPPILGGAYALQGLDLLTSKQALFTSKVYEQLFQFIHKPTWGLLFLVGGLWVLLSRWLVASITLVAILAFWDSLLLQSVLLHSVHWGVCITTTAAIVLILASFRRGTITRRHTRAVPE